MSFKKMNVKCGMVAALPLHLLRAPFELLSAGQMHREKHIGVLDGGECNPSSATGHLAPLYTRGIVPGPTP